jgi:hypothetical protein
MFSDFDVKESKAYKSVSNCQLPKLANTVSALGSLIRIKALHANALSRFQSNSDRFKLAVVFVKLVNDCQLGTPRPFCLSI